MQTFLRRQTGTANIAMVHIQEFRSSLTPAQLDARLRSGQQVTVQEHRELRTVATQRLILRETRPHLIDSLAGLRSL